MKKEKGFDYFDSYEKQASIAQEMILNLASALGKNELGKKPLMDALHTMENDADEVNHRICEQLLVDFVVPLERDSMASLAHALDDVCDAVEQVAVDAYMHKFEPVEGKDAPEGTDEMVALMKEGAESLVEAAKHLRSCTKDKKRTLELCVEVEKCESKADKVYVDSVRALYEDESLDIWMKRTDEHFLTGFEDILDALENAAERIQGIVIENS